MAPKKKSATPTKPATPTRATSRSATSPRTVGKKASQSRVQSGSLPNLFKRQRSDGAAAETEAPSIAKEDATPASSSQPESPAPAKMHADAQAPQVARRPLSEANERELRAFDLDQKYGPSVGLSRTERWQRAKRFGKEPPEAVGDILHQMDPKSPHNQSMLAKYPI